MNHNVNFLLPATDPRAQMGYVIAESTEYPVMSGSNTICVATVILETGIIPMEEPVTHLTLESPAGLIELRCQCFNGKVVNVEFKNQPSFVHHIDKHIEIEGLGSIKVDVAYGGMTYALTNAEDLGFTISPDEARELSELGEKVKSAAAEQLPSVHPENALIKGVTNTEFTTSLRRENGMLSSRNTVVVSPGRVDRSPCGTGTSARLALMHAKNQISVGERFIHQSITGSTFESLIDSETTVGSRRAIIPKVSGQGWITAISQIGIDPTDPFQEGYTLSDTWLTTVDDKLIKTT